MKKIIFIIAVVLLGACTENFEEINKNPYQISEESLEQDFNHVGAYFKTLWTGNWWSGLITSPQGLKVCSYMVKIL